MRGKFIAEVEYDRYLIECRADVAEGIVGIQQKFDEWLYDRNNDHGLWVAITDNPDDVNDPNSPHYGMALDPDGRDGVSYGINDFLNWLNQNYGCDAKIVAGEEAGLHHIEEYNEWLCERGLAQSQVHFVSSLDEYNRLKGTEFSDWSEIIKSVPEKQPDDEYKDPLRHFEEFEKAMGLTPAILRLHREEGVPMIYF